MRASDQVIFRAGDRALTNGDAVRAAEERGAVEQPREHVRRGLACQRYAEDEGFECPAAEIAAALDAFRVERDLISADDTEKWLERHDVALEDLAQWIQRRHWEQRFWSRVPSMAHEYPVERADVETLLWPELVFGAWLDTFASDFAARIACRLAAGPIAGQPDWADDVVNLERVFQEQRRALATSDDVAREHAAHAASLLRFDVQLASFASADRAREAWLCAAEDGEALDSVARRAGGHAREGRWFLDALPEALRPLVLSAAPGEIIRPVDVGDGQGQEIVVCRVAAKLLPDLDDEEVRRRIESALIARAIESLVQQHIRWADQ